MKAQNSLKIDLQKNPRDGDTTAADAAAEGERTDISQADWEKILEVRKMVLPALAAKLRSYSLNPGAADEILAAAEYRVITVMMKRALPIDNLRGYVYRSCQNELYNFMRHSLHFPEVAADSISESDTPFRDNSYIFIIRKISSDLLMRRLFDECSPLQRQILIVIQLSDEKKISVREICRKLEENDSSRQHDLTRYEVSRAFKNILKKLQAWVEEK